MPKKYIIRGKEIEECTDRQRWDGTWMGVKLNELLEALNEEKEEVINVGVCLHCNFPTHKGRCWISKEEPKSALKEEKCKHKRYGFKTSKLGMYCFDCDKLLGLSKDEYLLGKESNSALKEALSEIIFRNLKWKFLSQKECEFTNTDEVADQIISLFKDTLLKEIKYNMLNYITDKQGKVYLSQDVVEQIIKRL